jgi:hypothetical protein
VWLALLGAGGVCFGGAELIAGSRWGWTGGMGPVESVAAGKSGVLGQADAGGDASIVLV